MGCKLRTEIQVACILAHNCYVPQRIAALSHGPDAALAATLSDFEASVEQDVLKMLLDSAQARPGLQSLWGIFCFCSMLHQPGHMGVGGGEWEGGCL